jgi:hypothetical protein
MRACKGLKPPDITSSSRRFNSSASLVDVFFSIAPIPYHNFGLRVNSGSNLSSLLTFKCGNRDASRMI